jgi:hypothetical protein
LDNYVCVACGYVESYILDASKLRKITEKWPKVLPREAEAKGSSVRKPPLEGQTTSG